ncbi:unnamed protein product [Parnassius apollo]|uniref:(apollo) hypothetical protein n=1 Tax=Parnassius apollo TaxID=110799 RepID=A0A8S3WMD5_PARAO|nr:unnamed protein product [Parnassius apollo]
MSFFAVIVSIGSSKNFKNQKKITKRKPIQIRMEPDEDGELPKMRYFGEKKKLKEDNLDKFIGRAGIDDALLYDIDDINLRIDFE